MAEFDCFKASHTVNWHCKCTMYIIINLHVHMHILIPIPQEMDVGGVKFTAYNAGHVLGAAMFLIEIAGVKVSTQ